MRLLGQTIKELWGAVLGEPVPSLLALAVLLLTVGGLDIGLHAAGMPDSGIAAVIAASAMLVGFACLLIVAHAATLARTRTSETAEEEAAATRRLRTPEDILAEYDTAVAAQQRCGRQAAAHKGEMHDGEPATPQQGRSEWHPVVSSRGPHPRLWDEDAPRAGAREEEIDRYDGSR